MEQDAFRGNDTWKDQSVTHPSSFPAELEEGRVIEEAKNHLGERERGQQKRIIARAKPTRLQSSRRLSLVNAIVPWGEGTWRAHALRNIHALDTGCGRPGWTEKNTEWNIASLRRWISEKKIYIDACLIAFLGSFFKRILFINSKFNLKFKAVRKDNVARERISGASRRRKYSVDTPCSYIYFYNLYAAAFPQNRFETFHSKSFCGRGPQKFLPLRRLRH